MTRQPTYHWPPQERHALVRFTMPFRCSSCEAHLDWPTSTYTPQWQIWLRYTIFSMKLRDREREKLGEELLEINAPNLKNYVKLYITSNKLARRSDKQLSILWNGRRTSEACDSPLLPNFEDTNSSWCEIWHESPDQCNNHLCSWFCVQSDDMGLHNFALFGCWLYSLM